jgi:hypothetical protein
MPIPQIGVYSTEEDEEEVNGALRRAQFEATFPPEPEPEPLPLPEPVVQPPAALPELPPPVAPVVDERAERRSWFDSQFGSQQQEQAERRSWFDEQFGPASNSILERYATAPLTPEAVDQTVQRVATTTPRPGVTGDIVPNQFDSGLSTADAYAACGPVAAVAFARSQGRNPTVQEAVELARQVGWTPERGMAGPQSQKSLLDKMGVPSKLETGVDWAKVRADAESGNPVIIDTPGHYFVATGFDPETGRFDFGASGTALRGGRRWMTPQELAQTGMGAPRSALYLDNPDTPQTSVAVDQAVYRGEPATVDQAVYRGEPVQAQTLPYKHAGTDEGVVAQKYGLDPDIFFRQISQESGGRANAVSPAGARGIGQFMPGTAAAVAQRMGGGVTAEQVMSDRQVGLEAAAFHMRELLNMFDGDYAKALAAYNAGPGAVQKYGGVPPFRETQTYIAKILGNERPSAAEGGGAPLPPPPPLSRPTIPRREVPNPFPQQPVAATETPLEPSIEGRSVRDLESYDQPTTVTGPPTERVTYAAQNAPARSPAEQLGQTLLDALGNFFKPPSPEALAETERATGAMSAVRPQEITAGIGRAARDVVTAIPAVGEFERTHRIAEGSGIAPEGIGLGAVIETVANPMNLVPGGGAMRAPLRGAQRAAEPATARTAGIATPTVGQSGSRVRVVIDGQRRPDIEQRIVAQPSVVEGTAREVSSEAAAQATRGRTVRGVIDGEIPVSPREKAIVEALTNPYEARPEELAEANRIIDRLMAAGEPTMLYSGIPIPMPKFAGIPHRDISPGEDELLSKFGAVDPEKPGGWIRSVLDLPRNLRRGLVSADARLSDAQKVAAKSVGGTLPEELRATELLKAESSAGWRSRLAIQGPLRTAYAEAKGDVAALEKYLEAKDNIGKAAVIGARQGPEVAASRRFSGGVSAADSERAIEQLRTRLGPERFASIEHAADRVYDVVDGLRARMVQAGVWSQDFADQMSRDFPNYIPTHILDYMDDPARVVGGKKITMADDGVRALTAEGTERARLNVTESLVKLTQDVERRAARNETARAVYKWREISPELGDMMREVGDTYKATKDEVVAHFFDDGVGRRIVMSKDFAKAIEFAEQAHLPGPLEWMLGRPAQLVRATAVTHNPLFALFKNTLLDIPAYLFQSSVLYGPQRLPVFVRELARNIPDVFAGLTENRIAGEGFQRFLPGGGQYGYHTDPRALGALADEVRQGGGYVVQSPLDFAKFWAWDFTPLAGERIENAPRVAAFRLAERYGADDLTAKMRGRGATMDFSEGGEWTKMLNSVIPFFNISTRPIPWLANLARNDPKGFTAAALAGVVAPTVAAEAWNNSNPERAAAYADVPDYVKKQGIVVMAPHPVVGRDEQGRQKLNYFLFPMRNFTAMVLPTRTALQTAMGQAGPDEWKQTFTDVVGTASPVQTDSATSALGQFVPTIMGTALQLATNKDWFRDRAIATEAGDERASAASKAVAGVTGARPSQVEFAARDIGTGVAGIVLAGLDVAAKIKGGEQLTAPNAAPGERPVTGGLVGTFVRHQGGQVDRDLQEARDQMRDQLLAEVRADPRWASRSPQKQAQIEGRISEFATKATYGTKTQPMTILRNAREFLEWKGATKEEQAEELGRLRDELRRRQEAVRSR